jgi:hypothetical protein
MGTGRRANIGLGDARGNWGRRVLDKSWVEGDRERVMDMSEKEKGRWGVDALLAW